MTSGEVADVMGPAHGSYSFTTQNGPKSGVMFGRSTLISLMVTEPLGLGNRASAKWPVRVGFDVNGRVDRIERGEEVEEAPKQ